MKSRPETHNAASGDLRIAYQAFGAGPALVWVPGWVSQLDLNWEEPAVELVEQGIGGIAVDIGARVGALETAGHAVRGVAGDWELFAAMQTDAE